MFNQVKKIIEEKFSPETVGFSFDDDNKTYFNGNIFANFVRKRLKIIYLVDENWYRYCNGYYAEVSEMELRKQLRVLLNSYVKNYWSTFTEAKYMDALRLSAYREDIGEDNKSIINLKNCLLNTDTFELVPHTPKIISTVQLNCEYNEDSDCPIFKQYLRQVFAKDKSRIRLIQEVLGYLISKDTQAQKAFFLVGNGSNGKSLLLNVVSELIGYRNIVSPSLERLGNRFVLATLFNAQLILIPEAEMQKGFKTDYFKSITAGDLIMGERKNKEPFSFRPTAKLCIALNRLIYTKDNSNGYMRRLLLIHFDQTFSAELGNIDVDLGAKLLTELSGILNFSLRGLKRLRRQNYQFSYSQSTEDLMKEYRIELNSVAEFVQETIIVTSHSKDRISNREVYENFIDWCRYNNHQGYANMSTRKFWTEFKSVIKEQYRLELSFKHSGNKRYICGVSSKNPLPFKSYRRSS